MFNFFLIIYLLKDMVENFMEFMPSIDLKMPLDSRNINQLNNKPAQNSININPLTSTTPNATETINSKSNLNSSSVTEFDNLEGGGAKNIGTQKKLNNISLSKNNISKANSKFKNKKLKKIELSISLITKR